VRIAKFGSAPSADSKVVEPGEKGIQRETWGPGRYFINPISWDTELHDLIRIKPGDPSTWKWAHTTGRLTRGGGPDGNIISGEVPQIGILTRKTGRTAPSDEPVPIASNYKGIIREVLPPGEYRINPYEYACEIKSALIVPTGFVGVVTNQTGQQPGL